MKSKISFAVKKSLEYEEWLLSQTLKARVQIADRLSNMELFGHFGTINDVEDNVWELKWKNGRRIYFAYIPEAKILLLLVPNQISLSRFKLRESSRG